MNNSKTLILFVQNPESGQWHPGDDNRAVTNAAFDHWQMDASKGKDDEDLDFPNNILLD